MKTQNKSRRQNRKPEKVTELPEETEYCRRGSGCGVRGTEGQKTVDEKAGLTLGEVLLQAEDQGIDIQGLENGESVSFTAQVPAAKGSKGVPVRDHYPGQLLLL